MIVLKWCEKGSLRSILKAHKKQQRASQVSIAAPGEGASGNSDDADDLPLGVLLKYMSGIVAGMAHLAKRKFGGYQIRLICSDCYF